MTQLVNSQPLVPPKRRRRWFQFSLRTLLILVTLAAIPMSWLAVRIHRAKQQRKAVEMLNKRGFMVEYDYQDGDLKADPPGPTWLRKILGDDFFADAVSLGPFEGPSISSSPMSDEDLEYLESLPHLKCLDLLGTPITDLEMKHLRGLTRLEGLTLNCTKITDAGFESLKGMTQLQFLYLFDAQITDASLEHLKGLKQLQCLILFGTRVTYAEIDKLKKSLPNVAIDGYDNNLLDETGTWDKTIHK